MMQQKRYITSLHDFLLGAYGEYKRYMRTLVEPLMKQVGFELRPDDQPLDVHLRRLAIAWACSLGIKVIFLFEQ